MKVIDALGSYSIGNLSSSKNNLVDTHNKPTAHEFKTFISIGLPILMSFLLKEKIRNSLLLKFIIIFPPSLYSIVSLLTWNKFESGCESSSKLSKILHSIFNSLILTFISISILSIILFTFEEWDDEAMVVFPAYLLSISCSITSESISFIDNGIDIFIDLIMLLCPLTGIIILSKNFGHIPYFSIASLILTLIRLVKENYSSPEREGPPTIWRQLAFIFILIFITLNFLAVSCECIAIINHHFHLFNTLNSFFSEN